MVLSWAPQEETLSAGHLWKKSSGHSHLAAGLTERGLGPSSNRPWCLTGKREMTSSTQWWSWWQLCQQSDGGTFSGSERKARHWRQLKYGQAFEVLLKSYKENRNEGNEVKRKILEKKKNPLIIAYVYADNTDQQRLGNWWFRRKGKTDRVMFLVYFRLLVTLTSPLPSGSL